MDGNTINDYYENQVTSFYLYSQEDYPSLTDYNRCMEENQESVNSYAANKWGMEVILLKQLQKSTWRSFDQVSAALFVVPIHFGFVGRFQKCQEEADVFLSNITFTKNHVCIITDNGVLQASNLGKYCSKKTINIMNNECSGPPCKVIAPVTSLLENSEPFGTGKREDGGHTNYSTSSSLPIPWKQRNLTYYFGGKVAKNPGYKSRRRLLASFSRIKDKITSGEIAIFEATRSSSDPDYLERMRNTKFGLHVRGDNPTSNRLYEMIEVESLIVVISDSFYDHACPGLQIPWREFTLQIKETSTDAEIDSQLIEISNLSEEVVMQKLKIMRKFKKRILLHIADSKAAETVLIDAVDKCIKSKIGFIRTDTSCAIV